LPSVAAIPFGSTEKGEATLHAAATFVQNASIHHHRPNVTVAQQFLIGVSPMAGGSVRMPASAASVGPGCLV